MKIIVSNGSILVKHERSRVEIKMSPTSTPNSVIAHSRETQPGHPDKDSIKIL